MGVHLASRRRCSTPADATCRIGVEAGAVKSMLAPAESSTVQVTLQEGACLQLEQAWAVAGWRLLQPERSLIVADQMCVDVPRFDVLRPVDPASQVCQMEVSF